MAQVHEQNLNQLLNELKRVCAGLQTFPLNPKDPMSLDRCALLCSSVAAVSEATAERASELATLIMQRAEDDGR